MSTEKRGGERTEEARTEEKREAEGPGQPITTEGMVPVSAASRQGQWLLVCHRNSTGILVLGSTCLL